jgi:putative tricarboxylic transport membrane protein
MSPVRIANKKDLSSGLFFLVLGLLLILLSLRHSIWGGAGPQEGFFPLLIGLMIVGFSLTILLQSLWSRGENGMEPKEEGLSVFRVAAYISLMLLYGVFFEGAGFLITSTLFLLLILKGVEKKPWKITLLVGLISVMVSYFLFASLLGVPLPQGWLKGL